ncbi:hypothetical protein ACLKA7_005505 [Drosophila subpalustris]
MMTNFVMPIIRRKRMGQFWFQQEGAPPHTSRITIDFLKKLCLGRLMSKSGDLDRPPHSPDLTPPDFFLWGYLKSKVYVNKSKFVKKQPLFRPKCKKGTIRHQGQMRPFERYRIQKFM